MKVTTNDTKAFQPFELTVKIESLDELKVLWAHLNYTQDKAIEMQYSCYDWLQDVKNCEVEITKIWKVLDDKTIELGVKDY